MYYNSLPRRAKREEICPRCPVCKNECETICFDRYGNISGCDVCTETKDAWDVPECLPAWFVRKSECP